MKRVNIEQARKLKELGFKYPMYYTEDSAPYIAEALEWIRNEKEIYCSVELGSDCWYCPKWYNIELDCMIYMPKDYKLYEEAESALLDELILILEEK